MVHADDETDAVVFESAFDPMGGSVSQRVAEAVAAFYKSKKGLSAEVR